jgi:hypothetical protein
VVRNVKIRAIARTKYGAKTRGDACLLFLNAGFISTTFNCRAESRSGDGELSSIWKQIQLAEALAGANKRTV